MFEPSDEQIRETLGEANRLLFQIFLVHIITCIINRNNNIFSKELFRSLIITAMAIILYHIFVKKITNLLFDIDGKENKIDNNNIYVY
jgi:hypothetical protein